MKKYTFIFFGIIAVQAILFAGGSRQSASSSEWGSYLAELGRVIPPEEIYVDSYIAQSDSSRFISDRKIMEQTFGSELDRLVVSAA